MTDKQKAEIYDQIIALLKFRKEQDDVFQEEDGVDGIEWDSADILEKIENIL